VSRRPLEPLELALSLLMAAAIVATGFGLGVLGPLAVLIGGLAVLGVAGWLGGYDSRDSNDRGPFPPR
jgi:hypothetical protein